MLFERDLLREMVGARKWFHFEIIESEIIGCRITGAIDYMIVFSCSYGLFKTFYTSGKIKLPFSDRFYLEDGVPMIDCIPVKYKPSKYTNWVNK